MAIGTFTRIGEAMIGNRKIVWGHYAPAASTGASGDALTTASLKQLGLSKVDSLIFQQLHGNGGANGAGIAWRRDTSAGGGVHIFEGVAPHTHSLLVKGGQAAAGTAALAHYATDILGKEAATDATIVGSASATKGGVLAAAAGATTVARQSGGDFSSFRAEFQAIGRPSA